MLFLIHRDGYFPHSPHETGEADKTWIARLTAYVPQTHSRHAHARPELPECALTENWSGKGRLNRRTRYNWQIAPQ